ncbi:hypothetical protein BLNAU_16159 [Blattamonas nauphoetae]|uniref:WW domain-containing protein n=1 Tax=Blattamonas nauphoetae TaxID=2049346 RepID=A0ABQ9XF67_9EUKA|nr:hypothetical protein BLNAU_16159 [Blattamonas nauphoetae]
MKKNAAANILLDKSAALQQPGYAYGYKQAYTPQSLPLNDINRVEFKQDNSANLSEIIQRKFALPPNWTACTDQRTGQVFYVNSITGETQWERPLLAPEEMQKHVDDYKQSTKSDEEAEEMERKRLLEERINEQLRKEGYLEKLREKEEAKRYQEEIERLKREATVEDFAAVPAFGQWTLSDTPSYLKQRSDQIEAEMKNRNKEKTKSDAPKKRTGFEDEDEMSMSDSEERGEKVMKPLLPADTTQVTQPEPIPTQPTIDSIPVIILPKPKSKPKPLGLKIALSTKK